MATPAKPRSSSAVARARGKKAPAAPRARRSGGLWNTVKSYGTAVLFFLVVRAFLVEAFRIPSGSMIPTLLVGDWLFVNKLRYGPHVPLTGYSLPGYAEPQRGDVVVFKSPYQADEAARGADPTPTLVKRLVGVPGDTIYMRRGLLHINGVEQRQGYAAASQSDGQTGAPSSPDDRDPLFEWQQEYALRQSRFGPAPATPSHDNWGPLVVPERRFFMLGDARYYSKDGRYWGLVPRENVRGRPLFVYYSYNPEAGIPFVRAFTHIRWSRIGHVIR
ncbi:MAG: Signal peptidase I [uncultured Gemmatimonadaceae bacterium]|uniref:Signal peptidase I n=1 Tax=uncultured Gemmatimonadaceae bacterium TaxID=246130 RepID=A0A6J4KI58_9BACT|nr:MAG: Signal peptidase I [uncultured Gemmatimonadaceae bacterium]